jgi:predicted O-linked N-acetylglucosamine transferase (SPINDLY family)
MHRQGRLAEAAERLKLAVEKSPNRADLLNDLGNLQQDMNDQESALKSYRRAVEIQPDLIAAHQNLGYLCFNFGETEEALAHYEQAQRLAPSPMSRLLSSTVLPIVYDSREEISRWRKRFAENVRLLVEEGVRIDTTRTQVPTDFFLAYQGGNDRDLVANFGRIYRGVDLCSPKVSTVNGRKIKVGFLSAYFREHTIGRLNLGRIQHLNRAEFDVSVIYIGRQGDEMTQAFRQAADRFIVLPRDVEEARRRIGELELDILFFTEVGMDAVTYTLAFSRMAPVQCVTWGHPDTTGSPAMDYFVSSERMETPDSDGHYSEKVVRLPNLGTYYYRPKLDGTPRTREYFGLDPNRHLYICPQTLFKFHPDMDAVLKGILEKDPNAEVVLLEGRVRNWTEMLQRRIARTLGDNVRRVRFLPSQPYPDFLQLMALSDVMLDPFPFGGGNTSYEAFALGTPIVTWPSEFARGRITLAQYHKMGWTDCVVNSREQYIDLAVRLANVRAYRASIREKLRTTSHLLFEDPAEVRAIEAFFRKAVSD